MTTILLLLLTVGTFVGSLFQAWLGVTAYYVLAILSPQSIWYWIFGDMRVSFYIAISALMGLIVAVISKKVKFSILKNMQNLYLLIFWILIHLSLVFSQYAYTNELESNYRMELIDKMFIMYFVAILLIDTKKKFHYFITIMLVSVIYYTYWGNNQYFSGQMWGPRLMGPIYNGNYKDENTFAMFFVLGIPFLYFMGCYYQNRCLRYMLWGTIPFAWHAIFLTASRGGLLGVGVVTLFIGYRSKSKLLGMGIIIGLVVALSLQGGYMRERGKTIASKDAEPNPRLESWKTGMSMMKAHPLLGVGLNKFVPAYLFYSKPHASVHVAHSAVIQVGAECGVLAALMFLLLNLNLIYQFWKYRGKRNDRGDPLLSYSNDATVASLLGFFTCAIFLDLAWYENFYYLLVLSIVRLKLLKMEEEHDSYKEPPTYSDELQEFHNERVRQSYIT
jgi:probable O-glycosylation ligase (exosortase A-associated)